MRNPFARRGQDDDLDLDSGFVVAFDPEPDPALWLIGPTESRPVEDWLPGATDLLVADFGLEGQDRAHEMVGRMLAAVYERNQHGLPYLWLRWTALDSTPVALWFGMAARDTPEALDNFLAGVDGDALEPPIVETLEDEPERTVRRSVMYRHTDEGEVIGSLRYAVDQGDPGQLVLAVAGTWDLAGFDALTADCDAVMRGARMVRR